LQAALDERPKILAVGYASNATGTIHPLEKIISMARDAGALVYVDAVQYAPHGPTDVQALGCDFLVCSSYKFFGPHMGILYGRYDLLESLKAYRVRPAPALPPGKFETGTGNFEHIAGLLGVLEYFEWIGKTYGQPFAAQFSDRHQGRRLVYKQAMAAIQAYEEGISKAALEALEGLPGCRVYGITDLSQLMERVPTFGFTLEGCSPQQAAKHLAERDINIWDGNFYALAVTERLGIEDQGGLIRVGPVHYNTVDEVQRLEAALRELAAV
jgi:selenocysteine lyase/cysteine desulfurase